MHGYRPISEVLGKILEPVIARRTGMQFQLLAAWKDIVSEEFSETTRPIKIKWPKRIHEDDAFEPAVLILACEPAIAIFFQHELPNVLERVNLYFGFEAVNRIKILQKPVCQKHEEVTNPLADLSLEQQKAIAQRLKKIENPELRETLERLGHGILRRSNIVK